MPLTKETFSDCFELIYGGYKEPKILNCSLKVLLEKQNHTSMGRQQLIRMWPMLIIQAKIERENRKFLARQNFRERMDSVMRRPSWLASLNIEPWPSGGSFVVPFKSSNEE